MGMMASPAAERQGVPAAPLGPLQNHVEWPAWGVPSAGRGVPQREHISARSQLTNTTPAAVG